MFSVVVENRIVSNTLLKEKCFKYFMRFIPLQEISYRTIDPKVVERVEKTYNGKVVHALKTITYEDFLKRAMGFVFGNHFI